MPCSHSLRKRWDAEWALGWLYRRRGRRWPHRGDHEWLGPSGPPSWPRPRNCRGVLGHRHWVPGLATNIWWALGLLAIAGGADMISGIFRMSMWNQTVPDELRGRMAGLRVAVLHHWTSAGADPQRSDGAGGVVAVLDCQRWISSQGAAAIIAVFLPTMWRYSDVRTSEHAIAQRVARQTSATTT